MDLYELEKNIVVKKNEIKKKKERIKEKKEKLGTKSIDYSKVAVQSSPPKDPLLEAIAQIVEMEEDVRKAIVELDDFIAQREAVYESTKELKERDYQIYLEKKFKKMNNAQISVKHGGISKWTINRIVEKVEKNLKNHNEIIVNKML